MEEQGGEMQMMINEEGKAPRPISQVEIIDIMNKQIEQIKLLTQKNQALEKMVANLQKKIAQESELCSKNNEQYKNNKNTFTDILLARINELENQVNKLKNNMEQTNVNNVEIKSKTIPEVNVNIM